MSSSSSSSSLEWQNGRIENERLCQGAAGSEECRGSEVRTSSCVANCFCQNKTLSADFLNDLGGTSGTEEQGGNISI